MTKTRYSGVLVYFALTLAILAVFWQVRQFEFVDYDDGLYVYNNSYVKKGLSREGLAEMLVSEPKQTGGWYPLTSFSHMLDYELYGPWAGGHHFTALLLHTANSLLLLFVLNSMTGSFWPSAFVAAAFALHPLHVESVAWVSERKDVLSTFFWLLTMWAYTSYIKSPTIARCLLTLVIFSLAFISKSMVVTLPFVFLLLDYWPLNRFQPDKLLKDADLRQNQKSTDTATGAVPVYRMVLEKLPFFAFAGIASIITFLTEGSGKSVAVFEYLSMKARILNALVSYARYIVKTLYPSKLACLYPHPGDSLPLWQPVVSLIVLIILTAGIIYFGRQRRYLIVGWLWYLGTLVPVIGLIQIGRQAMADRYTYIPLIGLFIIIAWGFSDIFSRLHHRKVILSFCSVIIILALGILSWRQAGYWRNDVILFKHAIEVVPNNLWAHERLASIFYKQGKFEDAAKHFREMLRIYPDSLSAKLYLADILLKQDKLDEAVATYKQILPEIPDSHKNLPPGSLRADIASGDPLVRSGKLDEIVRLYTFGHYSFGVALSRQGKFEEAIEHFAEALRFKTDSADTYSQMGFALSRLGRNDEAANAFKEASRLRPDQNASQPPP